jgi:hypothetical protein
VAAARGKAISYRARGGYKREGLQMPAGLLIRLTATMCAVGMWLFASTGTCQAR